MCRILLHDLAKPLGEVRTTEDQPDRGEHEVDRQTSSQNRIDSIGFQHALPCRSVRLESLDQLIEDG